MMIAGLIGASGWFYLANYANSPFEATAASIVASLGVAISDVVADSIVVEKVRLTLISSPICCYYDAHCCVHGTNMYCSRSSSRFDTSAYRDSRKIAW